MLPEVLILKDTILGYGEARVANNNFILHFVIRLPPQLRM
jgi:hypothetical protein